MSRTTLNEIINEVRSLTMLGTADFSVGTMNYWDANQMQAVLDRYRIDFEREQLLKIQFHAAGSVEYYEYRSEHTMLEQTSGGTAIFIIEAADGTDQGTATWSADYKKGIITFANDTGGSTFYLTGRRYDIYGAAAAICKQTAAYYAKSFDVSTDGHRLQRSQLIKQFLDMAKEFDMKSEPEVWDYSVE